MTQTIEVRGARSYPVMVGNGLFGEVVSSIPASASRVAVIHPRALRATGDRIRQDLGEFLSAISI